MQGLDIAVNGRKKRMVLNYTKVLTEARACGKNVLRLLYDKYIPIPACSNKKTDIEYDEEHNTLILKWKE